MEDSGEKEEHREPSDGRTLTLNDFGGDLNQNEDNNSNDDKDTSNQGSSNDTHENNNDTDDSDSSSQEKGAVDDNEKADVFGWILQCAVPEDGNPPSVVLEWYSPSPPTPLQKEESLLAGRQLIRYGKKERGMIKKQPDWRKEDIRRLCERHNVPLAQALSLRRHHMKQLNLHLPMPKLGLGSFEDIQESARRFEQCVADFLQQQSVLFYSEQEQKDHIQQHRDGRPHPPTPDFLLRQEIIIEKYYHTSRNSKRKRGRSHQAPGNRSSSHEESASASQRVVAQRGHVRWIDAKMFYGASTIDHDNKSAVGCLLATARKYHKILGPGAFVFSFGYGDRLAAELKEAGAMCLDCSGEQFSLQRVQEHQQTWCGDKEGQIWP